MTIERLLAAASVRRAVAASDTEAAHSGDENARTSTSEETGIEESVTQSVRIEE